MMKRTKPVSVGDIMRQMMRDTDMENHLQQIKAAEMWPTVVGKDLAAKCGKAFCTDGVMKVRVPSPALRNELSMHRSAFVKALNDCVGADAIHSIIFIS